MIFFSYYHVVFSNVVEKCLTYGSPDERQLLVNEMLGSTDENEPLQVSNSLSFFFFVKIKNTLIVFLVTEFVVMQNKTIGNDERSFWKLRCPEGSRNL